VHLVGGLGHFFSETQVKVILEQNPEKVLLTPKRISPKKMDTIDLLKKSKNR
jgi:hypothetical protein